MTTLTRQDLNFGQVVADVLSEFLEVAVHLILYVREVYPVGIFQKRKKYNVPVQMSCHPELNQYIQDTLHCVKPLLEKNDVEKVVVVILDKEHRPVEKFVFEITQPPLLSINSDSLLSHVEQLLRAFILKISVCDAVLDHNPPGCTFTVLVHTREAATRNMEKIQVIKDFPWILADEQDVHMHDPRLIPLKTMTSDWTASGNNWTLRLGVVGGCLVWKGPAGARCRFWVRTGGPLDGAGLKPRMGGKGVTPVATSSGARIASTPSTTALS